MKLVIRFGLMALLASLAIGHAEAAFFPKNPALNPALNTEERTRFTAFPINHLDRGRMRVTLGISGAPSFRRNYDRYRSTRHRRYLRGSHFDPFWDRPFYGRHWSERHFRHYAPWPELRSRRWHRRYGRTLRSLHLERRQEFRPRSQRIYPDHQTQVAHRAWCYQNYRSYRASDNSFQPYRGGRKRCRSPYGR